MKFLQTGHPYPDERLLALYSIIVDIYCIFLLFVYISNCVWKLLVITNCNRNNAPNGKFVSINDLGDFLGCE